MIGSDGWGTCRKNGCAHAVRFFEPKTYLLDEKDKAIPSSRLSFLPKNVVPARRWWGDTYAYRIHTKHVSENYVEGNKHDIHAIGYWRDELYRATMIDAIRAVLASRVTVYRTKWTNDVWAWPSFNCIVRDIGTMDNRIVVLGPITLSIRVVSPERYYLRRINSY